MTNWDKEKAYTAKRAAELAAEMNEAIEAFDQNRFEAAYQASLRYMGKKQRQEYYKRFLMKRLEAAIV